MISYFNGIYRIIETRYGYMIEAKVIKTTGFLWWKKEVEEWEFVNEDGNPVSVLNSYPPFRTYAQAVNWLTGIMQKKAAELRLKEC